MIFQLVTVEDNTQTEDIIGLKQTKNDDWKKARTDNTRYKKLPGQ